jgi:transposase
MIAAAAALRAYWCCEPVDMRKSIDGLSQLVVSVFGADPFCGQLFVFVSRRRDRVKILYWDRHGFALWYKRLERGRFPLARESCEGGLSASELSLWLEGVDLTRTRRLAQVSASRVL